MHGVDERRVQLWIDALRSGEYQQGQGWLETAINVEDGASDLVMVTRHCCLGVAQRVALKNGWVPQGGVHSVYWGQSSMDLGAARWFGFECSDPLLLDLYNDHEPLLCVAANDDHDWTFEQIAQALEDRYITGVEVTGV